MDITHARAGQETSGTDAATPVAGSDDVRPIRRRRAVKWGMAAAAGAATLAISRPKETLAASGDNVVLGQSNDSDLLTEITSPDDSVLRVTNTDAGDGLQGFAQADTKSGVFGLNTGGVGPGVTGGSGSGDGVLGKSESGIGVHGITRQSGSNAIGVKGESFATADGGPGVYGTSASNDGVAGHAHVADRSGVYGFNSTTGPGVTGSSANGPGVIGWGNNHDGVQGITATTDHAGLYAAHHGAGAAIKAESTAQTDGGPGIDVSSQSNNAIFAFSYDAYSRGVRGIAFASTAAGVEGDNGGPGPGVLGSNTAGTGPGVIGESAKTDGVQGFTSATGRYGVLGHHGGSGAGVYGGGTHGTGVFGEVSQTGDGVAGKSVDQNGNGVFGNHTSTGAGVKGTSASGIGVLGTVNNDAAAVQGDNSGSGAGVKATNSGTGFALQVVGTVQFQGVAGGGTIPAGAGSAAVSNAHVTANSVINVTLMGAPGTGHGKGPHANVVLQWVERQPGSGFIVHLTDAAAADVPFTYLIIEP